MHLVEVSSSNALGMSPGRFLAEDVNSADMLARGKCTLESTNMEEVGKRFDRSQDWNNKRILFVRPGGFGDLLFLTPTFAEIKRRWPEAEIWVACFQRYHEALLHNPDVAGFIDYPVRMDDAEECHEDSWESFHAHGWLEGLIEGNPEAEYIHAVYLVAKWAGVELGTQESRKMKYFVTDEERLKATTEFPRSENQRRIGIQVSAGARCRTWPFAADLSQRLWRDGGHEVFLFGAPGEMDSNEPEGIVNLTQRGKSFRESCAILSTCDVLVAPDSALLHVAGALMRDARRGLRDGEDNLGSRNSYLASPIPAIGLYGPFPWRLRTAYAEKTFSLQGVCPISPCFHHVRPGLHLFPTDGPCNATGRCEALAMITVERVMREVEKKVESGK